MNKENNNKWGRKRQGKRRTVDEGGQKGKEIKEDAMRKRKREWEKEEESGPDEERENREEENNEGKTEDTKMK